MNYIDIILIVLLLLSAIGGYKNGFVEELAGLIGLILGIWVALHFSGLFASFLVDDLNLSFKYIHIVAFVVLFIAVVIVVSIAGAIVSKLVKAAFLGFLDKLAGLVFGVVKGALILSVVLVVFNKIDEDVRIIPKEAKANSRLLEPVRSFAPSVFPFLDFWKKEKPAEEGAGDRLT